MPSIAEVRDFLERFAPVRLAEDWDNVGLLVGDPKANADRVMTCLTVTAETVAEAIAEKADMIVSHHPLPFRPLKRITTDRVPSKMVWDLIRAGISIYSPHTGFDSATRGINQSLGERLGVTEMKPIKPIVDDPDGLGAGRIGKLGSAKNLIDFVAQVKQDFGLTNVQIVGQSDQKVSRVAMACGSGGSFLSAAIARGCDTFVTGETTFHTALEAKANGVALVLLGHYASERFAVESLADVIQTDFADVKVWASEQECDPISWM
jgi:dinuclear metal center YbgI/SA1388 family protein